MQLTPSRRPYFCFSISTHLALLPQTVIIVKCAFLQTHAQLSSRVSLHGPSCFMILANMRIFYFCRHASRMYLPTLHNDSVIICACAHTALQLEARSCIERQMVNVCRPCCLTIHANVSAFVRVPTCLSQLYVYKEQWYCTRTYAQTYNHSPGSTAMHRRARAGPTVGHFCIGGTMVLVSEPVRSKFERKDGGHSALPPTQCYK